MGTQATIDIRTFGAKCDDNGNTDDGPAINLAIAALKQLPSISGLTSATLTGPQDKVCTIQSTINLTSNGTSDIFTNLRVTIALPQLWCRTNNTPCIDALGSLGIYWNKLGIFGDCSNVGHMPKFGIQIGRTGTVEQASNHHFLLMDTSGCFRIANLYIRAAETTVVDHGINYNWLGQPALILDGCNHFNVTSAFVTTTVGQDVCMSFNDFSARDSSWETDNRGVGVSGVTPGPNNTIWMLQYNGFSFENNYACSGCNFGTPSYPVMIWGQTSASQFHFPKFDIHMEPNNLPGNFIVAGSMATPTVVGLTFGDYLDFVSNGAAVFNIDSSGTSGAVFNVAGSALPAVSITNATIVNGSVSIANKQNSSLLFDNPSSWNFYGTVSLPNLTMWNEPSNWSGNLCVQTATSPSLPGCFYSTPTISIGRNPDFAIDQPLEGTSTTTAGNKTITDGWVSLLSGGDVANKLTYQRQTDISSSNPTFSPFSFRATQNGALITPAVGSRQTLAQTIEGSDWAQFKFGTSDAQSFNFDFCAKANNTGEYAWAFSNGTRSYVLTYNLTANIRKCFHNMIPGDTGGVWGGLPGSVGIFIHNSLVAGTNFNTASPNSWQASFVLNTSNTFNILNTAGAFLEIDSIYIYPGPFRQPHQFRSIQAEYTLAQRFYQKSFSLTVAPAQSAGGVGATTLRAPYASAVAAAGTPVSFNAPMITSPTLTFFSTGAASANCFNSTAAGDIGAASAVNTGTSGFFLSCAIGGGFAAGDQIQVHWTADSKF